MSLPNFHTSSFKPILETAIETVNITTERGAYKRDRISTLFGLLFIFLIRKIFHVARLALEIGATLLVDTDTHAPEDLITDETALKIAMGAGLTEARAREALKASAKKVADIV